MIILVAIASVLNVLRHEVLLFDYLKGYAEERVEEDIRQTSDARIFLIHKKEGD